MLFQASTVYFNENSKKKKKKMQTNNTRAVVLYSVENFDDKKVTLCSYLTLFIIYNFYLFHCNHLNTEGEKKEVSFNPLCSRCKSVTLLLPYTYMRMEHNQLAL